MIDFVMMVLLMIATVYIACYALFLIVREAIDTFKCGDWGFALAELCAALALASLVYLFITRRLQ